MTAIATQTNSKSDVAAMAKAAGRYYTQLESATKPLKAGRQMNPRAGLKRAQKLPLADQILPPATQPGLEDRLRLSALQASMPRNAQLHKARSRICRHSICERMGFASTCRTKPCWQFHVAADRAVATALVSCSASNFSVHGQETPLRFWLVPASCSAWRLGNDSQHIEEQSQA